MEFDYNTQAYHRSLAISQGVEQNVTVIGDFPIPSLGHLDIASQIGLTLLAHLDTLASLASVDLHTFRLLDAALYFLPDGLTGTSSLLSGFLLTIFLHLASC